MPIDPAARALTARSRRFRFPAVLSLPLLLALAAIPLARAAPALARPAAAAEFTEPGEADMRRAYAASLQQWLASQGKLADPGCSIAGKGCAVVLLDTRRDYRLKSFRKRTCVPEHPVGFACSFEATVTCAHSSNGKPNPLATDMYCPPLFNKNSVYHAVFEYGRGGWSIARFTQG